MSAVHRLSKLGQREAKLFLSPKYYLLQNIARVLPFIVFIELFSQKMTTNEREGNFFAKPVGEKYRFALKIVKFLWEIRKLFSASVYDATLLLHVFTINRFRKKAMGNMAPFGCDYFFFHLPN